MLIKKVIKKIKPIYLFLLYIKINLINPAISGHLWYYLRFLFTMKSSEIKKLKSKGFKKIKTFQPYTWRIGKGQDRAFRRYYLAWFNNTKCFIKIGKNDITVANEAKIYAFIKDKALDFFANCLFIDENFDDSTVMIANEFIEQLIPFTEIDQKSKFDIICSEFFELLDKLESLGIIHADIHKGNILTTPNNGIVLLDFGISFFKGKEKRINYNMRPGTFYINDEENNLRKYDDAYSFVKMIEGLDFPEEWLHSLEYNKIVERIDGFSDWVQL